RRETLMFGRNRWLIPAVVIAVVGFGQPVAGWSAPATRGGTLTAAITAAANRFDVPAPILTAVCYLEGRFGDHGGAPSADPGRGRRSRVQAPGRGRSGRHAGPSRAPARRAGRAGTERHGHQYRGGRGRAAGHRQFAGARTAQPR